MYEDSPSTTRRTNLDWRDSHGGNVKRVALFDWKILPTQVAYATSIYLQDCNVVFFTLECGLVRGEYIAEYDPNSTSGQPGGWLHNMGMSLVPGQISIPMLVS